MIQRGTLPPDKYNTQINPRADTARVPLEHKESGAWELGAGYWDSQRVRLIKTRIKMHVSNPLCTNPCRLQVTFSYLSPCNLFKCASWSQLHLKQEPTITVTLPINMPEFDGSFFSLQVYILDRVCFSQCTCETGKKKIPCSQMRTLRLSEVTELD